MSASTLPTDREHFVRYHFCCLPQNPYGGPNTSCHIPPLMSASIPDYRPRTCCLILPLLSASNPYCWTQQKLSDTNSDVCLQALMLDRTHIVRRHVCCLSLSPDVGLKNVVRYHVFCVLPSLMLDQKHVVRYQL